jgi:EF-hand domain-containing protein 1
MERTRVLLPGSSLSDSKGPSYYTISDLYIGARIHVLSHQFILIDADEYVYNYLESYGSKYQFSDVNAIKQKVSGLLSTLSVQQKLVLKETLRKMDSKGAGTVDRLAFIQLVKAQFPGVLIEHEIVTFARLYEDSSRITNYVKLLESNTFCE